ncbi:unannotated protein [freshwater metagenome]|uniref:Unannotated protein n=1 Tax=freshwater metagenome TaxID=449393 RepID=A0A6J6PQ15_9ZZZZ
MKSASPPIGAAGSIKLAICNPILFAASSAAARLASAALTSVASFLAFSNSAFFSSPLAAPTDLDNVFCSARKLSNSVIALRRRSSALIN